MKPASLPSSLEPPALILAADHRARGVITVERYSDYLSALALALPWCDGILASAQPLGDLRRSGSIEARQRTYLSINRTGLAGSSFELDDRLVASVERAAEDGWTGIKHMVRIDMADRLSAAALGLLGEVLERSRRSGLEALVESLCWSDGRVSRDTDSVVFAAVVAHDMGAPVLKVAVPDVPPGAVRTEAVARVVESVGVPVLFLGGPRQGSGSEPREPSLSDVRERTLSEVRDVMAGGAAGMAIGRFLYLDPEPATMAKSMAEIVHGGPVEA